MTAIDLLTTLVQKAMQTATVRVTRTATGYAIAVTSESFIGVEPADRQAAVYAAFSRAPLELVAKVEAIVCRTPES